MFGRKRKLEDFSAEIEAYLQLEIGRLQEQGLSEEDARAAARRAFGNITQANEYFYESGRWLWLDHFFQDVRFGLRMLARSPSWLRRARGTDYGSRHQRQHGCFQCRERSALKATLIS